MSRVVIHIDRLVLNGFRRADGGGIAEALASELSSRLTTDSGHSIASQGDVPRLTVPSVRVAARAPGAQVGAAIGRGLAKGLSS